MKLLINGINAPLSVRRAQVREAMNEPFSITLLARSEDPDIDLSAA